MRTGKNDALSMAEMIELNRETRQNNHLYPNDATEREKTISSIVHTIGTDLMQERKKIDLRDTESVKAVVNDYIASCEKTNVLPSKSGLSRCLGYSRMAIYLYCRDHSEEPTAQYLAIVHDAFSEMVDLCAAGGSIHAIYGIWIQKSQFELRDNTPIAEPPRPDPLSETRSAEEIAQMWNYLIETGEPDETEDST